MGAFLRKYGTGTGADVYVPIIKRGVVDFAVGADWTPSAGDVKVSIDGGAAASIGTLPTAIAMGNVAYWKFVFADAELQGKVIIVTVGDSATKAVEDQAFVVETYGHASAKFIADISLANLPANVTQFGGSSGTFSSGRPEVNTTHVAGTSQTAKDLGAINVTNLNTLSGHDPGATLGTSTLTQAQVTGGAYALNSASFAFNAGLDFTTTQKAATLARVTLVDTTTTLTNAPSDSSGVTTLLSRVPSGIFTGITSLAQWLGLIAGKQTGNSTARTEIRATGAGSGTFDETTDSIEALRDYTAPASTALSSSTWTTARAGYLDTLNTGVTLATSQPSVAFTNVTINTVQFGAYFPTNFASMTVDGITGYVSADVRNWRGTAVSVPTTAGVPNVNVKTINDVVTTSVTTVYAHLGTSAASTAQTGDSYARIGAPAGASIAADIAAVAADNPNRPTRGVQLDNLEFTMVDATDFNTPETGVTVTAQIGKDGGAFANCTNAVSEVSAGWYKITLTAAEMTADAIKLKFTGAGCAQRNFAFRTQPT